MSLRHAILTALSEKSSTGLELTRRFDRSIGYFWQASHQQVYSEMRRLEADGFIHPLPQTVPARGNPKQYEVTSAGTAELRAWVLRSEDPKPYRDALLVRMRAATVVGLGNLTQELSAHRDHRAASLREYQSVAARDFEGKELDDTGRLQYLILQAGIGLEEFWIAWLDHALEAVTSLAGS